MKKIALFSACALAAFSLAFVSCSDDDDDDSTSAEMGIINGHDYVDLGLSVKWATCNVGASSPADYGDYYAWGETKTKSKYSTSNCSTYGKKISSIAGNDTYDVARALWGGTWRLPTSDEIDDLINKCQWEWVTQDGHKGYKVTGTNGNSIFLPAAGYKLDEFYGWGDYGVYWSATPYDGDDHEDAYMLIFDRGDYHNDWELRAYGLSVRPVSK